MKEIIQNVLISTINRISGVEIDDIYANLFDAKWNIPPEYFLYVIIELEKQYGWPIIEIIRNHGCDVFTIECLSNQIEQNMQKNN